MKNKSQPKKEKYPKIYSMHSQKGGVGKTSIAIAIAGLEAIFNGKKVLLIDADLTGTSIKDILVRKDERDPYKYINNVILAAPDDFVDYTSIISKGTKKKSSNLSGLHDFYYESEIDPKIFFSPSSPDYNDVLEIIPLISQEDYLHFFRHRIEDIIVTAINDGFEVIILDLSPGIHGLSKNICDMMFEQIIKREGENTEDTRLKSLFNSSHLNHGKTIEPHVVFVTTSDKPDYRALIPLFCDYIQQTHEKENSFKYDELQGFVDIIFNRIKSKEVESIDPPIVMGKILDDLEGNFINESERKNLKDVIKLLRERAKKLGAVSCNNIPAFEMEKILLTIKNLYTSELGDKGAEAKWCINISKTLNITDLKEIKWTA